MSFERVRLDDLDELLHRQVHPCKWLVVEGRPSSASFRPSTKDDGQLSVDRGSKASAEDAAKRFVARGYGSTGVWSVLVGEVIDVGLCAYDDPLPDNDAHALIDFSGLSRRDLEDRSKRLLRYACARPSFQLTGNTGSAT